ncbi:MAG: PD-(D/E)XK nuclease family transposase [Lachnospiraceae bacterium]|nr:PD-(D/E)XK nuclease family transposase [Lachnospiraceae bacterium]
MMDTENSGGNGVSEETRQKIREFRLMDDEFMTTCFEGQPDCMELILRIILRRSDLAVDGVWTQHFIKNIQGRSLRLDLHSRMDGREFNVEVQRDSDGAAPERARYHASVLDSNALKPGDPFDRLPEAYVIFITEKDYYGMGEPVYYVDRTVSSVNGGQPFNDRQHILYVNGEYDGDDDIGKLMHDFRCKDPDEMNFKELGDRARYFKETEKGVQKMSEVMKSYVHDEKERLAVKLIENGKLTYEEIAQITELPLAEIEELAGNKSA